MKFEADQGITGSTDKCDIYSADCVVKLISWRHHAPHYKSVFNKRFDFVWLLVVGQNINYT